MVGGRLRYRSSHRRLPYFQYLDVPLKDRRGLVDLKARVKNDFHGLYDDGMTRSREAWLCLGDLSLKRWEIRLEELSV